MAGKNIKQLPNRTTPTLNDILYMVANDTDYNVTLDDIKTLFGINDVEQWQTETFISGSTDYTNLVDSTIYGAVRLEYLAKRSGRGYRTGIITILVDDSAASGASISDYFDATRFDGDDLGLTLTTQISGGVIQLKSVVDSSDANNVIFNYKQVSKRLITVS